MWYNTQFSFGGLTDSTKPQGEHTPAYDDRTFAFNGDLSDVSSKEKKIPDLPIITVAEDTKTLNVMPHSGPEPRTYSGVGERRLDALE